MALNRKKIQDLQAKERNVAELSQRYDVKLPSGLWKVTADLVESGTALPWVSEARLAVGEDIISHPGKLPESVGDVDVRVLLLNGPAVATRFYQYKASLVLARKAGQDQFYGGAHDPALDGDSISHETLVKTAVRHLKQQSGLDLSSIPPSSWIRFATFEQKRQTSDTDSSIPLTTVVLLPALWQHPGTYTVKRVQEEAEKEVVTKIEKEVEEEVEVEIEVEKELPGQEGETDEDRKTEIVKEIQKKVEKKIVEEEVRNTEVVVEYWGGPCLVTLADGLREPPNPKRWLLALVLELLAEWIFQEAGTIITTALQNQRNVALHEQERKRKREEYNEALESRKKAKKATRDEALKERFAEMEARWKEDDEGKTDEELQECKAEREAEKATVTKEMQDAWAAEDLAEVPEPQEDDAPMEAEVNEDALAAFSILDPSLNNYGSFPSEQVSTARLQELLQGCVNTATSPATIAQLIKSSTNGLSNLRYRSLTDTAPVQ